MVCETFTRQEVVEPLRAIAKAIAEGRATPEQIRELLAHAFANTPAGPAISALMYVLRDVEVYGEFAGTVYLAPSECCRAIAELREVLSTFFTNAGRLSMLKYVNSLTFEATEDGCKIPLTTIYAARAIVGRAIGEGLL